jgi:hypothetical protein
MFEMIYSTDVPAKKPFVLIQQSTFHKERTIDSTLRTRKHDLVDEQQLRII